jgi:hypothetical protein
VLIMFLSLSLAMQYQLPTTIPAESKYRARSWVEDHRQLMCPQDGFLATCLEVCQIFRLLADLPACQERPNQTDHLLQLINKEWLEWKSVWFTGNQLLTTDRLSPTIQSDVHASTTVIPLRPRQKSLMRFCDHVVRFHITERHWVGQTKSAPGSSGTALALMDCFDAAIEVVLSFATDLADHGILPYAQDMVCIASSSAAIWIKRVSGSDSIDMLGHLFFLTFPLLLGLYRDPTNGARPRYPRSASCTDRLRCGQQTTG